MDSSNTAEVFKSSHSSSAKLLNAFLPQEIKLPECKKIVDGTILLLKEYTDAVKRLPQGDDYEYNSVFSGFPAEMQRNISRLEKIITANISAHVSVSRHQRLLRHSQIAQLYPEEMENGSTPVSVDVLKRRHQRNNEIADLLFENVDMLLDEVAGMKMTGEEQIFAFVSSNPHSSTEGGTSAFVTEKSAEPLGGAPSIATNNGTGDESEAAVGESTQSRQMHHAIIARPQLLFKRTPDNSHDPFKPLIFDFRNTDVYKKIFLSIKQPQTDATDELLMRGEAISHKLISGSPSPSIQKTLVKNQITGSDDHIINLYYGTPNKHPYKDLIQFFEYLPQQLRLREECPPNPILDSNLFFITTNAELDCFILLCYGLDEQGNPPTSGENKTGVDSIEPIKELAIDLEHHDHHSYQGFTCLMQLSTRDNDYLIDVFALRDDLHKLNILFLDPRIVKVLHGSVEDVKWLQKDFGLFLCNVFDTAIALQCLFMPHSLYFAVDHFCQVRLDKKYQMADWRRRPLPLKMVQYARNDTHYLLYIYDRLCNRLLHRETAAANTTTGGTLGITDGAVGAKIMINNLLLHTLNESKRLCLQVYHKPVQDDELSYKNALGGRGGKLLLLGKHGNENGLTLPELIAQVIFNWRDRVAREEDESPVAVMHPSSIISLSCMNLNNICRSRGDTIGLSELVIATSDESKNLSVNLHTSDYRTPRVSATSLLRSIHPLSILVRKHIGSLVGELEKVLSSHADLVTAAEKATTAIGGSLHKSDSIHKGKIEKGSKKMHRERYEPLHGVLQSILTFEVIPSTTIKDADEQKNKGKKNEKEPMEQDIENEGKLINNNCLNGKAEDTLSPLLSVHHRIHTEGPFNSFMRRISQSNLKTLEITSKTLLQLVQPPKMGRRLSAEIALVVIAADVPTQQRLTDAESDVDDSALPTMHETIQEVPLSGVAEGQGGEKNSFQHHLEQNSAPHKEILFQTGGGKRGRVEEDINVASQPGIKSLKEQFGTGRSNRQKSKKFNRQFFKEIGKEVLDG